jgi:hypothetical protein
MMKRVLKFVVLCVACFAVLVIAAVGDSYLFERQSRLSSACANTGNNGLWLRYYWYAGKHKSLRDWDEMLERLRVNQIKYAYFHVLTTKSDGTLKIHRLENAKKITSTVHSGVPGTKVIAWIYVGAAPQPEGLALSDSAVRQNLIKEALWLVNDCGFDGIQWDYEFCPNGDRGLLALLDETRAVLKPNQLLSVDTPMWYPCTLWGWNDRYFTAVASRCDQLCVMCYDSWLYLPRAYAWLLSQQVIHVSKAVSSASSRHNSHCMVIFGLPTYEDVTLAHRAQCESLANSLRGLNAGMASHMAVSDVIEGIALFANYTTDGAEWNTFQSFWLNCPRSEKIDNSIQK